jgi:uncharacterized lipoprotein YmbA
MAGMQSANDWAAAFGGQGAQPVQASQSVMQPNSEMGGMPAYSSHPAFQSMMDLFTQLYPGQAAALQKFSINPQTGAPASAYNIFNGWQDAGAPATTPPSQTAAQQHAQAIWDSQVGKAGRD